jgi:chemosensory pili system protein ChpE
MARGFWAALLVELGSLIGDATWAIIALVGLAFLVQNGPARFILSILGAFFLFYLAWTALREARTGVRVDPKASGRQGDFSTGAFLSLGNPFTVAFWLGVGSSTITTRISNPETVHFVVFFLAFMLGALIWCFILAGLVMWGRRFVNPGFFRWVNLVCAVLLGYFGMELFLKNLAVFF